MKRLIKMVNAINDAALAANRAVGNGLKKILAICAVTLVQMFIVALLSYSSAQGSVDRLASSIVDAYSLSINDPLIVSVWAGTNGLVLAAITYMRTRL